MEYNLSAITLLIHFNLLHDLHPEGMPNTAGLMARVGVRSDCDGDVIALMRKAGAIPLAVTNISELCMWMESSNVLYGRTNNAYHQGRMVGGSSGNLNTTNPVTKHVIRVIVGGYGWS